MENGLLKIDEAANYLRLTIPTLRKWRFEGKLPFYKLGRSIRFKKEDLDSFLSSCFQPSKYTKKF